MKLWVKFYIEALHDRKMRKLDRVDKSIYYDLLLLAGQEEMDGELPSIEDIALELDLKISEAQKAVNRLLSVGLLTETESGVLLVSKFHERQMSNLSDAEKKANYRSKQRTKSGHVSTECPPEKTDNVPTDVQEMSTLDIDIDKEIEKEKKKKKEKVVADATHTHKRNRGVLKSFGTAQNVFLSEEEYQKLQEQLGQSADTIIDELSLYMAQNEKNAKKYTDHYYTVLKWSKRESESAKPQHFTEKKRESWTEVADRVQMELDENQGDFWGFLQSGSNAKGEVIDI